MGIMDDLFGKQDETGGDYTAFKQRILNEVHARKINSWSDVQATLDSYQGKALKTTKVEEEVRRLLKTSKIYYTDFLPISMINRFPQGYTNEGVKEILNVIFAELKMGIIISDIGSFNFHEIDPEFRSVVVHHLPPIEVALYPGDIISLENGNHRYGVAKKLNLQSIKAFITTLN